MTVRITVAGFRAAVKGWLQEEKATKQETLELLDAVYAGVIDGDNYGGNRGWSDDADAIMEAIGSVGDVVPKFNNDPDDWEVQTVNGDCGCLLGTLDKLRGNPEEPYIVGDSAVTFGMAYKIPFGGTPFDNAWSKAAARGIEDYYASRGWR